MARHLSHNFTRYYWSKYSFSHSSHHIVIFYFFRLLDITITLCPVPMILVTSAVQRMAASNCSQQSASSTMLSSCSSSTLLSFLIFIKRKERWLLCVISVKLCKPTQVFGSEIASYMTMVRSVSRTIAVLIFLYLICVLPPLSFNLGQWPPSSKISLYILFNPL